MGTVVEGLEEFENVHGVLLASAGLPASLWKKLYEKLKGEVLDGGRMFEMEACEGGLQRRLLLACERLGQHEDVFLIDHAWSFRLSQARHQLQEIPGLAERMATLMCVLDKPEEEEEEGAGGGGEQRAAGNEEEPVGVDRVISIADAKARESGVTVQWLELDDLGVTDNELRDLNLSIRFPDLVGLSLWGNRLESLEAVVETLSGLSHLRALWLNNTPVNTHKADALREAFVGALPHLEIYNSKLTEKYGHWGIAFCGGVLKVDHAGVMFHAPTVLKNISSLDLSQRNMQSLSPHVFNMEELPRLTSLNLQENAFQTETLASMLRTLKSLESLQSLQVDVPGPFGSAESIAEALPDLHELNGMSLNKICEGEEKNALRPRLPVWSKEESLVERVMNAMWQYILTYRLADEEKLDETPIWYVMDELGSSLRHSDIPNLRVAPFMFLPDGTLKSAISYSLLWPVKDIRKGDECTRDYLFGIGENKQRFTRLTAWFHTPPDFFKQAYKSHINDLKKVVRKKILGNEGPPTCSILPKDGRPLSVFSDIPAICDSLSHPDFILVDEPSRADILWTHMQIDDEFQKAVGLQAHQYVNQFPLETCLVMKHNLAETVQKAYGSPAWLQPTYNMEQELPALIGDYLAREEKKQNNLWIVKPWNMARTIDTSVVMTLPALIRLVETGPKIGQKYIQQPALYKGRKFDLRYIVLLRSVRPLEIFLSHVFWARFSNNLYTTETSSLSEFDTHFTVMNYGGRPLNHIGYHDWIPEFEKEHNVKWRDIHERVRGVLRCVFEGAVALYPKMHSSTSRAIYGVDIMLDPDFQPKLLEVTYCPDCGRACNYDVNNILEDGELLLGSEFYNDVFSCLFLDKPRHMSPL